MIHFTTTIQRFETQGEKTGWTYIEIPGDVVTALKPENRQSFRVKGKLDSFRIEGVALLPIGAGKFIMPLNQKLRKGMGKGYGAMLKVELAIDKKPFQLNKDFMECLEDDPAALAFFQTLTPSHQRFFSKWIDDAKTEPTRVRRIAMAVTGLARKMDYGLMIRTKAGTV